MLDHFVNDSDVIISYSFSQQFTNKLRSMGLPVALSGAPSTHVQLYSAHGLECTSCEVFMVQISLLQLLGLFALSKHTGILRKNGKEK